MSEKETEQSVNGENASSRDSEAEEAIVEAEQDLLNEDNPDLDDKINEKLSSFGQLSMKEEPGGKPLNCAETSEESEEIESLPADSNSENMMLEGLLEKCEVTNLAELYTEWAKNKYGILPHAEIFGQNPVFTIEKVTEDLSEIDSLLLVKLLDPRPIPKSRSFAEDIDEKTKRRQEIQDRYEKNWYILNTEGLGRVLKIYQKRKILGQKVLLAELIDQFEIPGDQYDLFKQFVRQAISENNIYANYLEAPTGDVRDDILLFYNKYATPEKKRLLLILFVLLSALAFSIWGYTTFVRPLWMG